MGWSNFKSSDDKRKRMGDIVLFQLASNGGLLWDVTESATLLMHWVEKDRPRNESQPNCVHCTDPVFEDIDRMQCMFDRNSAIFDKA